MFYLYFNECTKEYWSDETFKDLLRQFIAKLLISTCSFFENVFCLLNLHE